MRVKINILTKKAGQCRGMRQWAAHCLEQFLSVNPKAQRIEPKSATVGVRIGGADNYLTFGTDSTNTIFQIELSSVPVGKDISGAAACKIPPIPMMAFLLSLLRVMPAAPGPDGDLDTVVFSSHINGTDYEEARYRDALAAMRQYVPEAWYVPFSKKIFTPGQFFAEKNAGRIA